MSSGDTHARIEVSAAAGPFRVRANKRTSTYNVLWYDHDSNGALVEHEHPTQFRTQRSASEVMQRLMNQAERKRPRVELCPNRNLYMLHVHVDGNLVRRSLGTRDPQEIPRRREIVMAKLGLGGDAGVLTVREMFSDYYDHGLVDAAVSTRQVYGRIIQRFRSHFTDDMPVSTITEDELAVYRAHRLESVQPVSFGLEVSCWNAAIRYAISRKTLDPSKAPPLLDKPERLHKERLLLTRDDWASILDEAYKFRRYVTHSPRMGSLELYLHMVRYTGGRASFYDQLQWSQVDMHNNLIDFQQRGVVASKRKRRPQVPIAKELLPVLQQAYAEREPGDDYVLWERGTPIGERVTGFARRVLRTSESARMRELSPVLHSHAFRRAYITWGMSQGLSSWLIGQVTGNSPAVIERYYATYRPDMGRSVVDSV